MWEPGFRIRTMIGLGAGVAVVMLASSVEGSVAAPSVSTQQQSGAVVAAQQAPVTAAKLAKKPKCGPKIRKPNGKLWRCTLHSKFSGVSLPKQWQTITTPEDGYRNGPDCYVDDPVTVRVRKGKLRLKSYTVPTPFFCKFGGESGITTQVKSGSVSTLGKFSQRRGRFAFRVKLPKAKGQGQQTAIWMHPLNVAKYGAYPATGEIDIAERFSRYPKKLFSFTHYLGNDQDPNDGCGMKIKKKPKWHELVLVWTKKRLKTYYDGKLCMNDRWISTSQTTTPAPFDQPFSILMQQGLGINDNAYIPGTTPAKASLKVDWVRVWR